MASDGILLGGVGEDELTADEAVDGHGAAVATLPDAEADRAAVEWPFQVGLVYTRDLFVDERYQRPAQERFITAMADEFDETLVGTIDVLLRGGLRGQRRTRAGRLAG